MRRRSLFLTLGAILLAAVSAAVLAARNRADGGRDAGDSGGRAAPIDRPFFVGYRVMDFGCGGREPLTVAIWYPTAESPRPYRYGGPTTGMVAVDAAPLSESGPYPLLIFSHGYSGGGIGSVFFTEALAARGWVVAAPDHHDGHSAVRIRAGQVKGLDRLGMLREAREITMSGPADRGKYLYRLDEMKCALDRVTADPVFGRLVDHDRIAVGGHSFGGFTALGLCGTIPERRDPRIKAVLLFSTGAGGYLFTPDELAAVRMPSMLFMGEREKEDERGGRTMIELEEKIYRALPSPKYFLVVRDGTHFSFNNRFTDGFAARRLSGTAAQFAVINRYAVAFLETWVAGRVRNRSVLDKDDPMLARYERPAPE